jgi:hypothetical protein
MSRPDVNPQWLLVACRTLLSLSGQFVIYTLTPHERP